MNKIVLNQNQIESWLYYETRFQQLHPNPHILFWAKNNKWEYLKDWSCKKIKTLFGYNYELVFKDEEMMTIFLLRWA